MNKYLNEYENQKDEIIKQLKIGEEIRHCMDEKSFQGRYYKPEWVVTSLGRVYSLACKRWLSIELKKTGTRNKEGQYAMNRYYIGGIMLTHKLVANYFCDKKPVQLYGEENIEVHHIRAYDSVKTNEENNCASNLCYVQKQFHSQVLNNLQRGSMKVDGEKNEVKQEDEQMLKLMTELATSPEAEVAVVHKGNGVSEVRVTASCGGNEDALTQEKIMEVYEEMQMARIIHGLRKEK